MISTTNPNLSLVSNLAKIQILANRSWKFSSSLCPHSIVFCGWNIGFPSFIIAHYNKDVLYGCSIRYLVGLQNNIRWCHLHHKNVCTQGCFPFNLVHFSVILRIFYGFFGVSYLKVVDVILVILELLKDIPFPFENSFQ